MKPSLLLLACLLGLALCRPGRAAEPLRYEVHVYFDRDQPLAGQRDKSPLHFRRAGSDKALDEEPILLALNDVVSVEVKARSPGTFAIDQWQRIEVWEETRKSGKKTVKTIKKLPHLLAVDGSLGKEIFLGLAFPEGPEKDQALKEGVNPPQVVDRPGKLGLLGAVSRAPPNFVPRAQGSRWESEPQRLELKNRKDVPWYTLIITIRR